MKTTEILQKILEEKGIGNAQLAGRLGVTPAVAWDRVNNDKKKNGLSIKLLNEILGAIDYKLVIVPREKKLGSGEYVVEQ